MMSTTLFARGLAVACVVALGCSGKAPEASASKSDAKPGSDAVAEVPPRAQVGQAAPEFELPDDAGNPVRLADHRGKKPVLLAFYPKDFTSG
jgi:cytochrome oxidase Cu insertion factor (SCO1/SenC/PrrC family)